MRKESSTNHFNQGVLRAACPVNDTLERLSPRWKMQVLFCIHQGQNRFSVLKTLFPSLSDQVLSWRATAARKANLPALPLTRLGRSSDFCCHVPRYSGQRRPSHHPHAQ